MDSTILPKISPYFRYPKAPNGNRNATSHPSTNKFLFLRFRSETPSRKWKVKLQSAQNHTQNWISTFQEISHFPDQKVHQLVTEFQSLHEPIDRVKRLLEYAGRLPDFPDSYRVPSNRVSGCAAEVWVVAQMDSDRRMRFWADSDSEIAKGFCSCLVWALDGSDPTAVVRLKPEDLGDLNVGLPVRAHSRANAWHNILIGMQKKTKMILEESERMAAIATSRVCP